MVLGIAGHVEDRKSIGERVRLWMFHIAGGVIGGAVTGTAALLVGAPARASVPENARAALCGVVLSFLVLIDFGLIRNRSRHKQVPATWTRRYGWRRAYFLYGLLLGSGLATYVSTAATYGVFVVSMLALPLPGALAAGAAFGLGRTFTTGVGAISPSAFSRIFYRSALAHRVVPVVSAIVTFALMGTILTPLALA